MLVLQERGFNIVRYEDIALMYAERYGIITYRVVGGKMIFNKTYKAYLGQPTYTVQHTIDLNTGQETTKRLSRVMKDGYDNV